MKADSNPPGNDGGTNVVIVFDGKLLEVHSLPGMTFNPCDNVKVDLESRRIAASEA